jgi:glycerol-3-phosphate dehydrogenase
MPHLYDVYGSRAGEVMDLTTARPELARPLSPTHPDIAAQVVLAARSEYCVRLADFLKRRTLLGATADQGWAAAPAAADILAQELGWSNEHRNHELEAYRREIDRTLAFSDARVGGIGHGR